MHFYFGDEIFYRCPEHYINLEDKTDKHVRSVCTADGSWSIPPVKCQSSCEVTFHIKSNESSCGHWTTPNFPENYRNNENCYVKFLADDKTMRFHLKIHYLDLEFSSRFSTECWDFIKFTSYTDGTLSKVHENAKGRSWPFTDTEMLDTICDATAKPEDLTQYMTASDKTTEECANGIWSDRESSVSPRCWTPKTLHTTTSNFVLRYRTDEDTVKLGGGITWWSSNASPEQLASPSCTWNYTDEEEFKYHDESRGTVDTVFGQISDLYHYFFAVLLVLLAVFLLRGIAILMYRKYVLHISPLEEVDDDTDVLSELESVDDSQLDLAEENDMSFLSLLELQQNSAEVLLVWEKLKDEFDLEESSGNQF